ncbi:MAG: hypothetical protein MZU95_12880 [Desulfomicrobium escambiense]|nr:hypothetical protein [Desulfomicrobium escambiense]
MALRGDRRPDRAGLDGGQRGRSACLAWAGEFTRGFGFLSRRSRTSSTKCSRTWTRRCRPLNEVRTDDALAPPRSAGRSSQVMVNQKAASENFIRAVVIGQQAKTWGAQSQDAQKRSEFHPSRASPPRSPALKDDLKALEAESAKFREYPALRAEIPDLGLAQSAAAASGSASRPIPAIPSTFIVGPDSRGPEDRPSPRRQASSPSGGRAFTVGRRHRGSQAPDQVESGEDRAGRGRAQRQDPGHQAEDPQGDPGGRRSI